MVELPEPIVVAVELETPLLTINASSQNSNGYFGMNNAEQNRVAQRPLGKKKKKKIGIAIAVPEQPSNSAVSMEERPQN